MRTEALTPEGTIATSVLPIEPGAKGFSRTIRSSTAAASMLIVSSRPNVASMRPRTSRSSTVEPLSLAYSSLSSRSPFSRPGAAARLATPPSPRRSRKLETSAASRSISPSRRGQSSAGMARPRKESLSPACASTSSTLDGRPARGTSIVPSSCQGCRPTVPSRSMTRLPPSGSMRTEPEALAVSTAAPDSSRISSAPSTKLICSITSLDHGRSGRLARLQPSAFVGAISCSAGRTTRISRTTGSPRTRPSRSTRKSIRSISPASAGRASSLAPSRALATVTVGLGSSFTSTLPSISSRSPVSSATCRRSACCTSARSMAIGSSKAPAPAMAASTATMTMAARKGRPFAQLEDLGTRMGTPVDLAQASAVHLGIALGRRQAGMSQKLLNGA